MKKRLEKLLLITCISFCSNPAFAEMDYKHQQDNHEHQHSNASSAQPHAQMQSTGSQTVGDITARLELVPYDGQSQAKLKKFGIIATHHLTLRLTDSKTNRHITNARVSAWTESKNQKSSSSKIKLISMKMSSMVGYSGDINLSSASDNKIVVEAISRDGKKSIFRF